MRKLMLVVAGLALAGCGPKVSSIEMDPKSVTLTKEGEVAKVTAVAKDEAGKKIEGVVLAFSSSDEGVAKVDPATGAVTAVKTGDAIISAKFQDKVTGEMPVVVSLPKSILVEPVQVELAVGATTKVAAKVLDEKSRPVDVAVEWQSGNAAIVAAKDGELTAVAPGLAQAFAVVGNLRTPVAVKVVEAVEGEEAAKVEPAKAEKPAAVVPAPAAKPIPPPRAKPGRR